MTVSPESARDDDLRSQVLQSVEAQRTTMAQPALEEGMSVNDWIEHIKTAAKQAHQHARDGSPVLQLEAFIDIAVIAVGRAEQLLLFQRQALCEHEWANSEPATRCDHCGLMLGDVP